MVCLITNDISRLWERVVFLMFYAHSNRNPAKLGVLASKRDQKTSSAIAVITACRRNSISISHSAANMLWLDMHRYDPIPNVIWCHFCISQCPNKASRTSYYIQKGSSGNKLFSALCSIITTEFSQISRNCKSFLKHVLCVSDGNIMLRPREIYGSAEAVAKAIATRTFKDHTLDFLSRTVHLSHLEQRPREIALHVSTEVWSNVSRTWAYLFFQTWGFTKNYR